MTLTLESGSLADLSLEQLSNLTVTSASKRSERLADAPAAIYVITNEDIKRAGATNLGEALRLAPNLEVAQVNSDNFAISSRGFLNLVTNKLLVLVDGRVIYSPVLSGVIWNTQDVMLEDVDRIEVISGPGAALYGADAFDGVINVITKSAKDTEGNVVLVGGGNKERDYQARIGAPLGDDGAYRIYAKHTEDYGTSRTDGTSEDDDLRRDQMGFRVDFGHADSAASTVQGDVYQSTIGSIRGAIEYANGANILGRYTDTFASGSKLMVQGYVDHSELNDPLGFDNTFNFTDLQAQYDLAPIGDHKISLGGGYRWGTDTESPTPLLRFIPASRDMYWGNVFAQDEYTLTPQLSVTFGLKVESNVYVAPQAMPDLRLAFKPTSDSLLWAAVSHAIRTPARVDRDFYFPADPPYLIRGGGNFQSETANVFELGYRAQPSARLSYSVNLYYNELGGLRSGQPAPGGGFEIANGMSGYGTGLEAWGNFQATDSLRLSFGLDELQENLHRDAGSLDPTGPSALGNDPRHQVKLRASYALATNWELNVDVRYISQLAYLPQVPAYNSTDFILRWHARKNLDFTFSVRDAFHAQHVEWVDSSGAPGVIPRMFYLQARCAF